MKTGNTIYDFSSTKKSLKPQWSPAMKTGNTDPHTSIWHYKLDASMEPGHEDREYQADARRHCGTDAASMEPGHEDREYSMKILVRWMIRTCLNGARP